jgi:hypothetical protein
MQGCKSEDGASDWSTRDFRPDAYFDIKFIVIISKEIYIYETLDVFMMMVMKML